MDVVTRGEGEAGPQGRRPSAAEDASGDCSTLYQDVVFLYRLVPGARIEQENSNLILHFHAKRLLHTDAVRCVAFDWLPNFAF